MSILAQLPTELIHQVFRQIPKDELELMFELNSLSKNEEHDLSFQNVRNIALYERYYHQKLFLTNLPQFYTTAEVDSLCLSSDDLDYLIKHQIYIKPKLISLIIYNTGPFDCMDYANTMLVYYKFISHLTADFNIQLVLIENCSERESAFINKISQLEIRVNWFAINNRRCLGRSRESNIPNQQSSTSIFPDNEGPPRLSAQNLKINLFNANSLVSQVELKKNTSLWLNLKMVDLSYNNIDDYWLAQIDLPETIEVLNLSNNSLRGINRYNFNLTKLPNLRELILDNNNITSISFCQGERYDIDGGEDDVAADITHPYMSLTKLSIMGNHLFDTKFLLDPCLYKLKQVDISRNLISKLHKFPPRLTHIDLNGNYLTRFFTHAEWHLFPCPNLIHLNLANCKITGTVDDDISWARFLRSHPNLIHVNNTGNHFGSIKYSEM